MLCLSYGRRRVVWPPRRTIDGNRRSPGTVTAKPRNFRHADGQSSESWCYEVWTGGGGTGASLCHGHPTRGTVDSLGSAGLRGRP